MRKIIINDAAEAAIRAALKEGHSFAPEGRRIGPDEWEVPLQDDTIEHLDGLRHPGESYSDAIIRLCSFFHSGGKLN